MTHLAPLAFAAALSLASSLPSPAIDATPDPIAAATLAFASTGRAEVLDEPTVRIFPFGQAVPTLECPPLLVCDIELQPGETVNQVALGDSTRWLSDQMLSGDASSPTPHVIVKPTEHGLATNLLITTTRRTYALALTSPPKGKVAAEQVQRVRFYYPTEIVQDWRARSSAASAEQERRAAATVAELQTADPTRYNFDYRIKPSASPMAPLRVFDDGVKTYVQLASASMGADTPALLGFSRDGEARILNYRPSSDGRWYIVDGIFPRLDLVLGSGRRQSRVTLENRRETSK